MIVVGLTGSLASGKSEAARIFKRLGASVFDADLAARKVVRKGSPASKAIFKIFGRSYFKKNGELDRQKLGAWVFSHPKDLKKLNILIHPGVIFECIKMIGRLKHKKGLLILDVPLLFESRMESLADVVVVVRSSEKQTIERAQSRGLSKELAKKILSAQWPIQKKVKVADFIIENNGTSQDLEKKVRDIFNKIKIQGKNKGEAQNGY